MERTACWLHDVIKLVLAEWPQWKLPSVCLSVSGRHEYATTHYCARSGGVIPLTSNKALYGESMETHFAGFA